MTTYRTDSKAKKRKALAYMRRWRRGLILKRGAAACAPYSLGYHRGYRAAERKHNGV